MLKVKLLGSPYVKYDNTRCEFTLRKSLAVLAYCILEDGPKSTDRISDLLWPDYSDAQKKLADAVYKFRLSMKNAGTDEDCQNCLVRTRDSLEFHHPNYYCDVNEFNQITALNGLFSKQTEELERAVNLYRGSFLEGFYLTDVSPEFQTWIVQKQNKLQLQYVKALLELALRYLNDRRSHLALIQLNTLIGIEPDYQLAYALLMVSNTRSGQVGKVRQIYQTYANFWREEFRMEPDSLITDLYSTLTDSMSSPSQISHLIENLIDTSARDENSLQLIIRSFCDRHDHISQIYDMSLLNKIKDDAEEIKKSYLHHRLSSLHLVLAIFNEYFDFLDEIFSSTKVDIKTLETAILASMDETIGVESNICGETIQLQYICHGVTSIAAEFGVTSILLEHILLAIFRHEHNALSIITDRFRVKEEIMSRLYERISTT